MRRLGGSEQQKSYSKLVPPLPPGLAADDDDFLDSEGYDVVLRRLTQSVELIRPSMDTAAAAFLQGIICTKLDLYCLLFISLCRLAS